MRPGSVSNANTRSIGARIELMSVWLTGRIVLDDAGPDLTAQDGALHDLHARSVGHGPPAWHALCRPAWSAPCKNCRWHGPVFADRKSTRLNSSHTVIS